MSDALDELQTKGYTVIPDAFTNLDILKLKNKKLWKAFKGSVIFHDNVGSRDKKGKYKGSTVYWLTPGRYDIALNHGIFVTPQFLRNEKVMSVVDGLFNPDEFQAYGGSLPSVPGSNVGEWHRDCSLFDITYDKNLPIYYITVLIPIVDLTTENGPLEVITGSHHDEKGTTVSLTANAGTAIILDGRVLHRGLANYSAKTRHMLYIVYCRTWYGEYEDYLVV